MMKKISLFLTAMVIGMAASAANYIKVTETPADWTGTYLIACQKQGVVFNGSNDTTYMDAKGGAAILTTGFSFNGDTLVGTQAVDTAIFTIGATDDDTWHWYIKSYSGLYIGHKDTADNGLSTEFDLKEKCKQKLVISEGNFIATAKSDSLIYTLQYNKKDEQQRFRYYVPDDQKSIQIYKLQEDPSMTVNNLENAILPQTRKVVRNGQLLIIKDGKEYSILGQ